VREDALTPGTGLAVIEITPEQAAAELRDA
jgi:hypothetical protein